MLDFFNRLKGAFVLLWQASPGWAVARGVVLFLQGTLPLASLYLIKLIIDTLTEGYGAGDPSFVLQETILYLGLIAVIIIIIAICDALDEMINTAQTQRIVDHVEAALYRKAIEIDMEYYEDSHYHNVLQRAQRDAKSRPNLILRHSTKVIQNSVSLIAMLSLLLSLNWIIVVILFATVLPMMRVRFKYADEMYNWHQQRTKIRRKANYFGRLMCNNRFAKEIRLFGSGSFFIERFLSLKKGLYQEQLRIIKRQSLANIIVQTLAGLLLPAIYGFVIYQIVQGELKIGDLVIYHQVFQRGQNALTVLVRNLSLLYTDNLFIANFNEFLELKPKIREPEKPKALPQPIQREITFKGVSFQYPNTERTALKNVNLTIRPGETIALVGENGSGKTTLVKLICRLFDVSSGRITIDGIDIREIPTKDLHHQISVIFQDFAHYDLSAQENIWLGNVDLDPDDPRILSAAQRSGADAVIRALPKGYQTILGKQFDGGDELSGGQWQKIALARAFARDSQVIVLDEPTSAMDPKAEERIFQHFKTLMKGQTAVLVTHRLSTVKMADCIYVMSDGSIVERGTHSDLMKLKGLYADLFETQAKNYRMR